MAKDRITGKAIPWDPIPSEGWIDGSVDNDLPMNRLAEMFCVNHFIVSQVNPHVVPFLAKEEEALSAAVQQNASVSTGPGWMHNMAAFAKGEALHRLDMLAEMGVFPNAVTKARSVLNQRYSGDITIFPTIHYTNFPKILSNPSTEYMLRSMRNGEQATWPKVSRVQNHCAVELALDKTINKMASRVVFSPNQINLRLLNFTRHSAQNGEASRNRRLNKSEHFINLASRDTPAEGKPVPSFLRNRNPPFKTPVDSKQHLAANDPSVATESVDFSKHSCSTADATSTDLDSSGDEDSYSNEDSNTSEILSSSSPPCSPPRGPELWPSARQVPRNPSSNPSTPSLSSSALGHHRYHSSISARLMSSAAPSSPELRYKRLFHPPPGTPPPGSPRLRPDYQNDVRKSLQPLTEIPTIQETMSPLGLQKSPPPADMFGTDIIDDCTVRAFNPPAFSPAMSPRMTRDDGRVKTKLSQRQQNEIEDAEQKLRENESAQGLGLGLGFDYSGTRGMMLRKQQSRNNGFSN
jgi:TAG lipase/steryl ester hydrolase/phospholipase A2/LPA acyltransferase